MIDHRKRLMLDKTKGAARPTCRVVVAGKEFSGKQGHLCAPGISARSANAQRIHLQIARLPPGNRSKTHKHAGRETAIYLLSGEFGMWYGDTLEQHRGPGLSLHPVQQLPELESRPDWLAGNASPVQPADDPHFQKRTPSF
jgi:uncharacterized RmlC-like cupin family protein